MGGAFALHELSYGAEGFLLLSDADLLYNDNSAREALKACCGMFCKKGLTAAFAGKKPAFLKVLAEELQSLDANAQSYKRLEAANIAFPHEMADAVLCFDAGRSGALDAAAHAASCFLDGALRAEGAYAAGCGMKYGIVEMHAISCDASQALGAFKSVPGFLDSLKTSPSELKRIKIGAMSQRLKPKHPEDEARRLAELSLEGAFDLQTEIDEILSLDQARLRRMAAVFADGVERGGFCAAGNPKLFPKGVNIEIG
jgi:hypothetical protein